MRVSCMDAVALIGERPGAVRVIDTETTGLSPSEDGILQVSVLDGDGGVLFDSLVRPCGVSSWPEAQRLHGITPDMVRGAPSMAELRPALDRVMAGAGLIVGYNTGFDLSFLRAAGVTVPDAAVCDVMADYAPIAGVWSDDVDGGRGRWRWQKLSSCARHYGYAFRPHDSLEDARATLYCCRMVAWDQLMRDAGT